MAIENLSSKKVQAVKLKWDDPIIVLTQTEQMCFFGSNPQVVKIKASLCNNSTISVGQAIALQIVSVKVLRVMSL
ncbi:hypothetical protein H6F98_17075 [Microcoleus sp. FACHB-SPT15]|uniref:hypothetical protein n=1 Tax=Microcoleus sp. FACHB-SPT15 TaxID=2692830 RepID=UPI0017859345|nr:hypothetical protein [Microcoleus sp. FACHB-SPT15]MBD1807151.1 hypothetical protein [Microcoleus sp. FACHB-SPT15]